MKKSCKVCDHKEVCAFRTPDDDDNVCRSFKHEDDCVSLELVIVDIKDWFVYHYVSSVCIKKKIKDIVEYVTKRNEKRRS